MATYGEEPYHEDTTQYSQQASATARLRPDDVRAAILDLWQHEDGSAAGDRAAARHELLRSSELVKHWYDELAGDVLSGREPPQPLSHDRAADGRLVDAVRHDLRGEDGGSSATAVRMIWTGDHLDAARRLQRVIVGPAEAASRA